LATRPAPCRSIGVWKLWPKLPSIGVTRWPTPRRSRGHVVRLLRCTPAWPSGGSIPARSPLNGTAAPAESTAASAASGPVVLGKVLWYRQLGGGYSLLPSALSPVECMPTLYVRFGMRVLALDVPPLLCVYICNLLHSHRLERGFSDSQKKLSSM
jgi:hypothetical protein